MLTCLNAESGKLTYHSLSIKGEEWRTGSTLYGCFVKLRSGACAYVCSPAVSGVVIKRFSSGGCRVELIIQSLITAKLEG